MANIPVERDTGTPWWLWLLGLLLLIGLVWLLIELLDDDDDDLDDIDDVEMVDPTAVDAVDMAAPMGLAALLDADAGVAGEPVEIEGAYVTEVMGDVFRIAPSENGETMMVYFDPEARTAAGIDDSVTLTEGQLVDVMGLAALTTADDVTSWGIDGLDEQALYVDASRVLIVRRATPADLADLSAMMGEMIELDGATVTRVVGDSTFYVEDPVGETLVMLVGLGESEMGPGDGSDGVFDVDAGDTIALRGEVMPFTPSTEAYGVTADDRAVVEERGAYLAVRSAEDVTIE